ncbi:hypothetical protein NMY22_g13029 [Coprinellus aureogranulatus]|nr:hypothetical protein NMY22_g13029 [Coprinellus aureogranulatus]
MVHIGWLAGFSPLFKGPFNKSPPHFAYPWLCEGFGLSESLQIEDHASHPTMAYSQVPVSLPRRHHLMPDVYEAYNHPLLDGVKHVGKVYVGYMPTDKKSVKNYLDFEKGLKCPEGGVSDWESQGLLQLRPGDYFFLRDPKVSDEPKDDVLGSMVTGRAHHGDAVKAHETATQAILGPREDRTASLTAFERTRCARKIQKKRCYSIGVAVQLSRRVVAPTASLDQSHENMEVYQTMVGDLISSTSAMLLNVQESLPKGCLAAFAANGELSGQPSVGKKGVYGTNSIQINISSAGLSASDNRLRHQLGDFGCEHYDDRDSPDHLTTMFSNPDIPENYDPGSFHVLQLGIFVVLEKYVGITFSGQRRHVGTAPTPPVGCPPQLSAYRCNVPHFRGGKARAKKRDVKSREGRTGGRQDKGKGKDVEAGIGHADKGGEDQPPLNGDTQGDEWDGGGGDLITPDGETRGDEGDMRACADGEEHEDVDDDDDYVPGSSGSGVVEKAGAKDKRSEGPTPSPKGSESGTLDVDPLYITPEMINMGDEGFVPHTTNRATFARSGHVIMDRESHVTFMGRSLHQLSAYVLRQLPTEYGLSIDAGKLLGSISYKDEKGNRVCLSPWLSAPNIQHTSEERKENKRVWSAYQAKVRRFIPRIAFRAFSYDDESDHDEEDQDHEDEDEDEDQEWDPKEGEGDDRDSRGAERTHGPEASQGEEMRKCGEKGGGQIAGDAERTGSASDLDHQGQSSPHVSLGGANPSGQPESSFRHVQISASAEEVHSLAPSSRSIASSKRDLASLTGYTTLDASNKRRKKGLATSVEPASRNTSKFPFLQNLTAAALLDEAREVERDFCTVFEGTPSDDCLVFDYRSMVNECQGLLHDPVSHSAPGHIRQIQIQIRSHGISNAMKAIETRWERYSVLLSSVHVWYWLDVVIKNRVEELFRGESTRPTGIGSPFLSPSQRLRWCLSLITVPNRHKRTYFTGQPQDQDALLTALVSTVQRILMDTLEYPPETDLKDRRRAWLMGTLAEVLGQEFLATGYAWKAWTSFTVKAFLGDTWQAYSKNADLIRPFKEDLQSHPICAVGSETWDAYQNFKCSFRAPLQVELVRTPVYPSSSGPSSSPRQPSDSSTTMVFVPNRFRRLDAYLRDCLEYEKGAISQESRLHRFLEGQPDTRYPFREKAPWRLRMQDASSPYHSPTIRTNAGAYSAVIHRGILFNSDFSRHPDCPMVFENFQDWEGKLELFKSQHPSISNVKNFFSRPDAYGGQSIVGRGVGNAKRFWQDVSAMNWPEKSKRVMTFKECYDLFHKGGFPTMGVLSCYLLACDLHYAGVCEAPTIADVASFIRSARGGSYHILPKLGYGEVDVHPTLELVIQALSEIAHHLRESFTEEELALMGFDLICVEHILCKFKRADTAEVLSTLD